MAGWILEMRDIISGLQMVIWSKTVGHSQMENGII